MRRPSLMLVVCAAAALAACGGETSRAPSAPPDIPPLSNEAPPPSAVLGPPSPPDCRGGERAQAAASDNTVSLQSLDWAPLGPQERGWEAYAPLIGQEIASGCPPQSPAFAEALARWQGRHRLTPDGRMTPQTFETMYQIWHARRPFSHVDPENCPAPPPPEALATAAPAESYGGKTIQLLPGALDALRRMRSAARAVDASIAADPRNLQVFSGFRDPAADLVRCAADGECDNRRRTWCSAHRTGSAMDLYVGAAPGYGPDSTAFESRLYLSKTPTYRWLVRNAWRFGFVNYVYEPWHWEWIGDPSLQARSARP